MLNAPPLLLKYVRPIATRLCLHVVYGHQTINTIIIAKIEMPVTMTGLLVCKIDVIRNFHLIAMHKIFNNLINIQ